MGILAIDQSLTNSGVAIYSSAIADPAVILTDSIKPKMVGIERLMFIEESLGRLLTEHHIGTLIMEDYAYMKNYGIAASGELGGIIKRLCYVSQVKCISLTPSTHKKFTTGAGNSKKEMMLKYVYKVYGMDTDDNNIADAVSLLRTYQGYLQHTEQQDFGLDLTIKRKEAIKAIIKSLK